ncbi:MAG TPA: hypothetical protein DEG17_06955 [Cyanobacteria bacterium UBA11149]|nr:hypothetical protein [Cyanobacteria bacterium UBA11367]HBE58188.1 hypothetical protein [Cyanobacteria bacterium UBA11366]HBK63315.1 hypothetical protein [Cyanobacteria bacterium UBA11166]HBR76478.1 hypothetical protein [Cyanobacteria bacterium UBA11159]HBS72554.1 hypothetical protein [Cyanobacteria bacterium UBA11153]HBW88606.1 hypothetical protein [Cyanobacteria bacterium UBA11149]HCA93573.1 hypothetical protein [Cyanobacteria bacterium UBA9226]
MFNFNAKRQKKVASLFCLSFLLVITLSCGAVPVVINAQKIATAANNVIKLMEITEKALYVTSSLVNAYYETLGEDINNEKSRASSKLSDKIVFSSEIVTKMENRYEELETKYKELNNSLDRTNDAANNFFSMLETRANQNSNASLREGSLRDISANKKTFSEKIEVAEDFSSKLKTSIKEYDNILNVFQISVALDQVPKYIETVDSVISQYKSLEQDVQIALNEGRQVIATNGDIPAQSLESTVPIPRPDSADIPIQSSEETVRSPISQSPEPTIPTPGSESTGSQEQIDRPLLGVQLISLTPELRQKINQYQNSNVSIDVDRGVLILEVKQDYPAAKAGIQVGDVIVTINGKTVTDDKEVIDEIGKTQVGTELPLEVYRGQQKLKILVDYR